MLSSGCRNPNITSMSSSSYHACFVESSLREISFEVEFLIFEIRRQDEGRRVAWQLNTQQRSDKIRTGSDSDQPRIHLGLKRLRLQGLYVALSAGRYAPSSDFAWANLNLCLVNIASGTPVVLTNLRRFIKTELRFTLVSLSLLFPLARPNSPDATRRHSITSVRVEYFANLFR